MAEKTRMTGIDVIGNVPWGTHFCLFYHTQEDLIDILVPYFRAGLENNEFCMWVTSAPLEAEEAKRALARAVEDLDDYIAKGQIEILDYSQWYTRYGRFEPDQVLQGWVEKENQALRKGFDGLRLTGNTFWLEKQDWRAFADYEATVHSVIGKYRMIALCTYSLDKCGAPEIMDVSSSHQFALIRRQGKWEQIESAERKRAEEALQETTQLMEAMLGHTHMLVAYLDRQFNFVRVNPAYAKADERAPSFFPGKNHFDLYPNAENQAIFRRVVETGEPYLAYAKPFEYAEHPERGVSHWDWSLIPIKDAGGTVTGLVLTVVNVTAQAQAEEALRKSEERYQLALRAIDEGIWEWNIAEDNTYLSSRWKGILGYADHEFPNKVGELEKYVHPDDRGKLSALLQDYVEGRVSRYEIEFRAQHKDGSYRWIQSRAMLVRDANGKPLRIVGSHKDITERKRVEQELFKLRAAVDASGEVIFMTDREGVITFVNPEFARLYGYTASEVVGRTTPRILKSGVMKPEDYACFWQTLLNKQVVKGEFINKAKDGRLLNIEGSANPILDEQEQIVGFLAIQRDVTERKRIEATLWQSEEKYRTLIDNMQDGVFIIQDAKMQFVNEAFARMVGYTAEQVIGMDFRQLVAPEDLEMVADRYRKRQAGEDVPREYEFRMLHKDGKTRVLVNMNVGLVDYQGKVASMGTVKDITERKRAEKALADSVSKYRSLVETAGAGVATVDIAGNFTFVNQALCDLTGYAKEELLGQPFARFLHPDDLGQIMEVFQSAFEHPDRSPHLEFRGVHKDGHAISCYSNPTVLWRDDGIVGFNAIVIDITERKRAEEALRESEERYRLLFQRTPIGIVHYDTQLHVTDCNDRLLEILQTTRERAVGLDLRTLKDQSVLPALRQALEGREGFYEGFYRATTGAAEVWVSLRTAPLFDKHGRVIGGVEIVQDITERKQAEEALHKKDEHHRNVVESIFRFVPEGLLVFAENFTPLKQNKAFEEIVQQYAVRLGYTEQELAELITEQVRSRLLSGDTTEIHIPKKRS
jgi:hypothetical protein